MMTDSSDSFVISPETNEPVAFVSLLTIENLPQGWLKDKLLDLKARVWSKANS
jgi:hypothetical protein